MLSELDKIILKKQGLFYLLLTVAGGLLCQALGLYVLNPVSNINRMISIFLLFVFVNTLGGLYLVYEELWKMDNLVVKGGLIVISVSFIISLGGL